jgi:hypothetical protein
LGEGKRERGNFFFATIKNQTLVAFPLLLHNNALTLLTSLLFTLNNCESTGERERGERERERKRKGEDDRGRG